MNVCFDFNPKISYVFDRKILRNFAFRATFDPNYQNLGGKSWIFKYYQL